MSNASSTHGCSAAVVAWIRDCRRILLRGIGPQCRQVDRGQIDGVAVKERRHLAQLRRKTTTCLVRRCPGLGNVGLGIDRPLLR